MLTVKEKSAIADTVKDVLYHNTALTFTVSASLHDLIAINSAYTCIHQRISKLASFKPPELAIKLVKAWLEAYPQYACESLLRQVEYAEAVLAASPSYRDVYDSLDELADFFDDVPTGINYNHTNHILTADTEDITFDDVELGSFGIHLRLLDLHKGTRAFNIEAYDPFPATKNGRTRTGVVHPHVENSTLCAGEAQTAIAHALLRGDISNAFLLVRNVLRNYNPDSAYVSIAEWRGQPCYVCGTRTSLVPCECCDESVCEDCITRCDLCDNYACVTCISYTCSICGISSCYTCASDHIFKCPVCSRDICDQCEGNECELCWETTCTDCDTVQSCSYCDKLVCANCRRECAACGLDICKSCLVTCNVCGADTCPDCAIICNICADSICPDCAITCSVCNDDVCPNCVNTCKMCGQPVCSDCAYHCAECHSTICDTCAISRASDNSYICASCSTETNDNEIAQPSTENTES